MNHGNRGRTRRQVIGAAALAGLGSSLRLPLTAFAALSATGTKAQESAVKLVLLGTQGGPNFNPERGESASAVVVGAHGAQKIRAELSKHRERVPDSPARRP